MTTFRGCSLTPVYWKNKLDKICVALRIKIQSMLGRLNINIITFQSLHRTHWLLFNQGHLLKRKLDCQRGSHIKTETYRRSTGNHYTHYGQKELVNYTLSTPLQEQHLFTRVYGNNIVSTPLQEQHLFTRVYGNYTLSTPLQEQHLVTRVYGNNIVSTPLQE